jgi:uncharacterized membrane protein
MANQPPTLTHRSGRWNSPPLYIESEVDENETTRTAVASWDEQKRPLQQRGFLRAGEQRFAQALGWFSIALGLAQVIAPSKVSKLVGVDKQSTLMRTIGTREIVTGVCILTQPKPGPWLWGRVAGDMMDLTLLGLAMRSRRTKRVKVLAAASVVLGVTVLDVLCSQQVSRHPRAVLHGTAAQGSIRVDKSVTVNRSAEDCYLFWQDLENLPRFMQHLESVRKTGEKTSHWVAKAPGGGTVEWDAEIVADRPDEMISWHSLPGSDVAHAGSVRFEAAPAGRGTVVRVQMQYSPPAGVAGTLIAKLVGEEPDQQVREDLRRLKQMLEAGEIPTTEGQPSGKRSPVSQLFSKVRL